MSKILYVLNSVPASIKEWIATYGVDTTFIESQANNILRPQFKTAISSLNEGDELIIRSFSHSVQTTLGMALLIDYCRIRNIRLISIEDEIDTHDVLFKSVSPTKSLNVLASLSINVLHLRKQIGEEPIKTKMPHILSRQEAIQERDLKVVNLYLAGHTIQYIMERIGIKHTTLYRILKINGIKRDRLVRNKFID